MRIHSSLFFCSVRLAASIQFSLPEPFPSAEEFLLTFDKHVTSFNLFNDCNYPVIIEVVCSSVLQKVFCKFTATNFAFNMVSMVVES